MLKTAIKSSLKEVEGVFRLFNSRKDLFMNHLSGPKGPQFPESANLFHDHRSISINYKTIQISTSPPKKKHNFKAPNLFRTFTFLSLTLFLVHCTKDNQTNKPTTPPQGTPSTIAQTRWFFTTASPHIVTMTLTRLSHLLPWNLQGDH